MSDLLSLLSFGSAALSQQNTNIAVTANNVANVDTEGYSRQRTDVSGTPIRIQSSLLSGQIQTSAGSLAMSQSFSDAITALESQMSAGGTIGDQLGALYSKLSAASAAPTDSSSRDAAVAAARALVAAIQQQGATIAAARKTADASIRSDATSATALANQLAGANAAVARSGDPASLDRRDQLAKQLGQLVGGQARIDGDGQMRYVLDGGAVLVDGSHASSLTATADPTTGLAKLEVVSGASRRDVTSAIAGGSIGGELALRDQAGAQAASKLDQVAYDVTTSFNAVHSANAGLDGVTGRPMFTPLTQVAGAASAIALDPALSANSKLLALAAPGAGPGDNQGALALFQLGNQNVATGGTQTLGDAALDVMGGLGQASSDAKDAVTRDGLISDHLASLRDSLSGVDSTEELTNLARFQQASSSMTKVVSTINDMLGSLIDAL